MAECQGTLPDASSFCLEYPGYVEDLSAALETVGGVDTVRRHDQEKKPQVVHWPSGNPIARSLHSSRSDFNGLVLTVDEEGTRIERVVRETYRFSELCDFAYTPGNLARDAFERMGSVASSQGKAFEKRITEEPHFSPEPLLTVTPTFTQIAMPTDAVMKEKSVSAKELQAVRPSRQLLYHSSPEIPLVPRQPTSKLDVTAIDLSRRREGGRDNERWKAAAEILQRRPIWSKQMLMCRWPTTLEWDEFLSVVKPQCYQFADGPWQKLWIRRGYDPRFHPEARQYQVIVYPSSRNLYDICHIVQRCIDSNRYFRARRAGKLASIQQKIQHDTVEHLNRFESWPRRWTYLLQVCDLEDDRIRSIVNDDGNIRSSCCCNTGWFVEDAWNQIHRVIEERMEATAERLLREAEPDVDAELVEGSSDQQETQEGLMSLLGDMMEDEVSNSEASLSEGDMDEDE